MTLLQAAKAMLAACQNTGKDRVQQIAYAAVDLQRAVDGVEAWNPTDTAYRPGGIPQDFVKHEVDAFDAWSEWVSPKPEQYFMKCCDCGLVHEMQFRIAKYSEGDECEFVEDDDLQAVFRARRTAAPAEKQQWVGLKDDDVFEAIAGINLKPKEISFGVKKFALAIEAKLKEKNT